MVKVFRSRRAVSNARSDCRASTRHMVMDREVRTLHRQVAGAN